MSTISRYWDKYKERHRSESIEKSDINKLVSDKQAYISFLEVQLERVTQTVLTTQGFSDRIESLQTQLNSSDEKIVNLTRLVKLQQTFAENQEDELSTLKKIIGAGFEPRNSQGFTGLQNIDRRVKILEDRLDSPKADKHRFEDFVKEIDAALKATEFKITDLVGKVTEEVELKQIRLQKYIEDSLEKCSRDFEENYQELSRKIYSRKIDDDVESKFKRLQGKVADYEKEGKYERNSDSGSYSDRILNVENGLRDLEQFLVAIAEEVKKVEEKYRDTSEIEYKVTNRLNGKVQKLSELVKKSLNLKRDPLKSPKTPEIKQPTSFQIKQEYYAKESPKFPNVSPPSSSIEHDRPRDKSKESNTSNERSKSPKEKQSVSKDKPNTSKDRPKSPKDRVNPQKDKSSISKDRPKSPKDRVNPQKDKSNISKERPKSPNERNNASKEKPKSLKERSKSPKARGRPGNDPIKSPKPSSSKSPNEKSKSPKSVTSRSRKSNSSSKTPKSRSSSRTPKSQSSLSPNRHRECVNLSETPKTTKKSQAMEVSIKGRIEKMKHLEHEERKVQHKKEEKRKTKKSSNSRSKLDELYQELSGKNY